MMNQAQRRRFGGRTQSLACRLTFAAMVGLVAAFGQNPSAPEINSHESQPSFRLQVQRNLVLVRVVVRDSKGRVLSGLHKEDFKLFDNRKPQVISQFSVETPASPAAPQPKPHPQELSPETPEALGPASSVGWRYQALYFDDLNVAFEDLAHARDAADRFLGASLAPSDRAGIFTSSALNTLDFTDDRAKLHEALFKLRPHSRINPGSECPEISDYQAEQMVDYEDPQAIAVAVDEDINRCHEDPRGAEERVKAYARRALDQYEYQAQYNLRGIEHLVRRMAALPGQRNITLVSCGFLPLGLRVMLGDITDRALRSNVVISSLDPRGLPVRLREADATREYSPMGTLGGVIRLLDAAREMAASEVMEQLAADTGGEYFHDNNDLLAGFAKVAGAPETYYLLAFSPQNLKRDGSFHNLKVALVDSHGYTLHARRGYFAPKKLLDVQGQAKEEVESAAFSQDEVKELPIRVHTQYFKSANGDAQLSVLAHLDIRSLRFRKEQDRNANDLMFVTVLFDRDGKYADGRSKEVVLRLRNPTLDKFMQTGITIKTDFKVKPGTYVVREVVRDGEEGHISGVSRPVEIPF